MKRRIAAFVLFSVLITGSYSIGFVPTDKMQVKQMRVNGVDLAYVEEGRGETVVFVHGAFGDWRNWERLRPAIAAHDSGAPGARKVPYCGKAGRAPSM